MFKQFSYFFFSGVFLVVALMPATTHAMDISAVLQRMDAIIQEMKELRTEFASLSHTLEGTNEASPIVLGSVSGGILGDDIRFGSTNEDIKRIQKLLATDSSIYPYGVTSGFFGPKTRDAIRAFQARFDLDTVGVVGPSTRALLEVFFAAYPDQNYPVDVLRSKPSSTHSVVQTQSVSNRTGAVKSISILEEDDEYIVKSYRADGTRNRDLILYPKDTTELIDLISQKLHVTTAVVRSLVDATDLTVQTKKQVANTEGLKTISVQIREKDAIAEVEYEDGSDKRYRIRETKKAYIVTELAERLDVSKDSVESVLELDYGSIEKVTSKHSGSKIRVYVDFDSGMTRRFTFNDDETEASASGKIADELFVSEDEILDHLDFDF